MPSNHNKPNSKTGDDANLIIAKELVLIRQLLTLLVVKLGADSNEIGMATGTPPRTVRDWIPFRKIAKVINENQKEGS